MYTVRLTIPCGPLMIEEDVFVETDSEVERLAAYGEETGEFSVRYTRKNSPKTLYEVLGVVDEIRKALGVIA